MNVAVAGLGFMGATHLKAWRQIPAARLVAVQSSDEAKLAGDLTSISGNLGSGGEKMDFSGIRKYGAVAALLQDPDIDAIDLCVPTDQHAPLAIAALRAGKHVFLEKPMALDPSGADAVRRAAEESGRVLMVGHVLRFIPAYRRASKDPGRVHSALFRRRCAAPAWSKWLADPGRSGGGVFDLLIHDADYCISLWGMPQSVHATGYEDLAAGVDILHAELTYPGMGPVIVTGGWHHPKSFPFSMEFTIVTEDGTLEWSSANSRGLEFFGRDGEASVLPLDEIDPFEAELRYFTECVQEGRSPTLCPPEQSAQAVVLMRFMLESRARNGKVIETS